MPDYVAALQLSETETEFPLIPACIVTYIHFHRGGSVSIDKGVKWGKQWVKKDCTVAAVTGRFKRLTVKYPSLEFTDGVIRYKGVVPVSCPNSSVYSINQTIALLCLTRLEKCLPAQFAIAFTRRPSELQKQADVPSSFLLLEERKAENRRLIKITGDILRQEYEKKRAILLQQLDDLDNEWQTPLKNLEKELEEEMKLWRETHTETVDNVVVENIQNIENVAKVEIVDEVELLETPKAKLPVRKPKKLQAKVTTGTVETLGTVGTALEPAETVTTPISIKNKISVHVAKQKERIRERWQEGSNDAGARIRAGQLTSQHVSVNLYGSMHVFIANVLLTCYVLYSYPGVQTMDLDDIPYSRSISTRCDMSRISSFAPSVRSRPIAVA